MFTERRRTLILLGCIIVLALCAAWVDLPDNPGIHIHLGPINVDRDIELLRGLDLQGGLQVLLEADLPPEESADPVTMEATRRIIEQRLDDLGIAEPLIQLSGSRGIIVELPDIEDHDRAIQTISETGLLELIDVGFEYLPPGAIVSTTEEVVPPAPITPTATMTPTVVPITTPSVIPSPVETIAATVTATASVTVIPSPVLSPTVTITPTVVPTPEEPTYEAVVTGSQVRDAGMIVDQSGLLQIGFSLNDEGAVLFEEYTRAHVGQAVCAVLDEEVVSCASIAEPIPGGFVSIPRPGGFTREDAESILIRLRYGPLPIPLRVETSRIVGPTLGEDSLRKSLIAGGIGLSLVVLFMLIYYRLPGVLADVALIIYAAIVLALFKLIPVVLTLPGIAGFILSAAMAVDANILILERMKEELRLGKELRLAVARGFSRAWPSIRDPSFAALIICAILFSLGTYFGVSMVKGFALTMGIGVLVSMLTAVIVTRTFLRLTVGLDVVKHRRWFGV